MNKEKMEQCADPFVLTPNPNAVVGGNPVGSGVMSSFSSCSIYCPLSFTHSFVSWLLDL